MRRFVSIVLAALVVVGVLPARDGVQAPAGEEGEKRLIDLKSDLTGPVAPGDSVIFLVGNFAAQHNGAVITCDSAVRYSDMRIEFFGNVLINKNTTYIYGDRAEYDGNINEARVYSDIVKVIDGDATLYTYKFLFNTKSNVGEFGDGGVLINRENRLEAVRGYYFADTKDLVAVDRVEMRNDEYELRGDSVVYNMATDNAFFFDHTHIWNRDGDYLYADRGSYESADTIYVVTRNGYLLTDKQEVWSDSIRYNRPKEHLILRRDLQLDDTEHKVVAFGDYGEYWKDPGNALLTRRPAAISYDLTQGDSLFMRADTMYLFTINENALRRAEEAARADSLARAALEALSNRSDSTLQDGGIRPDRLRTDSTASVVAPIPSDTLPKGVDPLGGERPGGDTSDVADVADAPDASDAPDVSSVSATDSLDTAQPADSLAAPVNPLDTLTGSARKAYLKEQAQKARAEEKARKVEAKKELLAKIAAERQEKTTAKLLAQKEREERLLEARRIKAASKLAARKARAERKGKTLDPDDLKALSDLESQLDDNSRAQDSLQRLLDEWWTADSLEVVSGSADSLGAADSLDSLSVLPADSIYRLMKGFRNVRIYRSDFQAVCDSMTAISTDSTIHLYIEPVLWNQSNQITSDVMDIYTQHQQLLRAEFIGSPMMVAQLDTAHYNQIAGKEMTAHFRNNEIYRNDVNSNVQTIYYMQDGEPPQITDVGFVESGDASFYIEDKQVVTIVYRTSPEWNIYPLNKVPLDQELFLQGFRWEGERRPSQRAVFDRMIRPSRREETQRLPHPDFPLMQALETRKKLLIEERRWTDRFDQVDPATVEWMQSLGFEVGQPRESSRGGDTALPQQPISALPAQAPQPASLPQQPAPVPSAGQKPSENERQ